MLGMPFYILKPGSLGTFSFNTSVFYCFNVCFQMSRASARTRKNGGVNNHTALKHSNA